MSDYTPDKWQIVRIVGPSGSPVFKVFGTWFSSYLSGPAWRLNSGIEIITDEEDYWEVLGSSGSVYSLLKGMEGMSGYTQGVFESLRAQIEASGGTMEVVSIHQAELLARPSMEELPVVKVQQKKSKKTLDK